MWKKVQFREDAMFASISSKFKINVFGIFLYEEEAPPPRKGPWSKKKKLMLIFKAFVVIVQPRTFCTIFPILTYSVHVRKY